MRLGYAPCEPDDELDGSWSREQLLEMDARFVAAVEQAFELGLWGRHLSERRATPEGQVMRDHYHHFSHPVLLDLPAQPTTDLFSEMDQTADEAIKGSGGRACPSPPPPSHPRAARALRAGTLNKINYPSTRGIGAIRCGETPKPGMIGGEVPIKHGSADGALASSRRREASPSAPSAAREVVIEMTLAIARRPKVAQATAQVGCIRYVSQRPAAVRIRTKYDQGGLLLSRPLAPWSPSGVPARR